MSEGVKNVAAVRCCGVAVVAKPLVGEDSLAMAKHVRSRARVFDADGKVLSAVREVLKICAERKLVVHIWHLSPSEALVVVAASRDMGIDRMVVTHAQFEVVNMSLEERKKGASMGAKLELCAMGTLMEREALSAWMRHWRRVKVEEIAPAVKEVSTQNFILATDRLASRPHERSEIPDVRSRCVQRCCRERGA